MEAQHDERGDRRRPAAMGEEQHQRDKPLDRGADVARIRDSRPGRRSSGKRAKNLRLMNRGRNTGLLLIVVEITNGKCLLSLDVAAPSQMTKRRAWRR